MHELIKAAVASKLEDLDGTPMGSITGRHLTLSDLQKQGIDMTPEQLRNGLAKTFQNIAERLGVQYFQWLPTSLLEQFTLMSILRNEDCAGMLKSLINSFMISYVTQATTDEAFKHLLGLEELRARVATSRGLTMQPMTPHPGPATH
ncbi:hypothetical protein [Pseudomonas syringae]|uniref:hypothetical protein n=1 Tax=Pseudomonas syringae TaxID=317 RepID=UPI001F2070BE|nr:hypothetical protein [Pseudomonas syringae]MCF5372012.1 hypothetical protein [Pseudomonas syringae]